MSDLIFIKISYNPCKTRITRRSNDRSSATNKNAKLRPASDFTFIRTINTILFCIGLTLSEQTTVVLFRSQEPTTHSIMPVLRFHCTTPAFRSISTKTTPDRAIRPLQNLFVEYKQEEQDEQSKRSQGCQYPYLDQKYHPLHQSRPYHPCLQYPVFTTPVSLVSASST